MEFGSPIRQNTTSYIAPIQTTQYLDVKYPSSIITSTTTPPLDMIEVKQYISAMAVLYEAYSLKWFNKKIPPFFFIQNVAHKWNHSAGAPQTPASYTGGAVTIHQVWRPETILIQSQLFQLHWVLRDSDCTSGQIVNRPSGESEEIPYGENQVQFVLKETPRSVFHRKIRRAKLVAAIAKLRVKKLFLKYYKRYGEFVGTEKDSPLSSDNEI